MFDWNVIFPLVADIGRGKGLRGIASRLCRVRQNESAVTLAVQVRDMRLLFVLHADEQGGEARDLPLLCKHKPDGLSR